MYAVIKTGGKQYRVAQNDVLTVEKLIGDAGAKVEFGEVLMIGGEGSAKVGAPTVQGQRCWPRWSSRRADLRSLRSRSAAAKIRGASGAIVRI